jgi:hypothetical protein
MPDIRPITVTTHTTQEIDVDVEITPNEVRKFLERNRIISASNHGRPSPERATEVVQELLDFVKARADTTDALLLHSVLEDAHGVINLLRDLDALLAEPDIEYRARSAAHREAKDAWLATSAVQTPGSSGSTIE